MHEVEDAAAGPARFLAEGQPFDITAYVADPNPTWKSAAIRAANWFHGENDGGHRLYDPETGAGYDGLHADSVNQNRGAESTLSALGAIVGHLRLLSLSP